MCVMSCLLNYSQYRIYFPSPFKKKKTYREDENIMEVNVRENIKYKQQNQKLQNEFLNYVKNKLSSKRNSFKPNKSDAEVCNLVIAKKCPKNDVRDNIGVDVSRVEADFPPLPSDDVLQCTNLMAPVTNQTHPSVNQTHPSTNHSMNKSHPSGVFVDDYLNDF